MLRENTACIQPFRFSHPSLAPRSHLPPFISPHPEPSRVLLAVEPLHEPGGDVSEAHHLPREPGPTPTPAPAEMVVVMPPPPPTGIGRRVVRNTPHLELESKHGVIVCSQR